MRSCGILLADGAESDPGPDDGGNLRRALLLSRGDWSVFLKRGLSASLLAIAVLLLLIVLLPAVRKKREEALVAE